jgi:nitric oxide synthase oxygenase domain/subunit/flavodoxin/ferredoxin-NADP reductase
MSHEKEIGKTALSSVDRVMVRDAWNKFVTQDTMLAPLFFERLIMLVPELEGKFGLAAVQAPAEFLQLFDLAMHTLEPATETALREAYHVAPAAREARSRSLHECGTFFATYGMKTETWEAARQAFLWAFRQVPYLEEYERADLEKGQESAFARFFAQHVEEPMNRIREEQDAALAPDVVAQMRAGAEAMLMRPQEAGTFFYTTLFEKCPDIVYLFRTADMDALSRHLIDTVVFLSRAADEGMELWDELRNLAKTHQVNQIPSRDYDRLVGPLLQTLSEFGHPLDERTSQGWRVLFSRVSRIVAEPMIQQERVLTEARTFIDQVATELGWTDAKLNKRWNEIAREVRVTGTYTHTNEELDHGAKLAWRNAPKCIGRISWKSLIVRDCRHVTDPDSIYGECLQHLRTATNGGNIEIVLSVFRAVQPGERWGPRLWNSQLIRYAGYEMPDGTIRGDRANLDLTRAIMGLGWTPPDPRGEYDLLPLVIDLPGEQPRIYPLDPNEVLEVPITHPTEAGIAALGMKWCAVPVISNFRLEIGGVQYGCVPFNGWFMGTEIARDLWEPGRYDRATDIADALGLDTSSEQTLWRDRAFLELNVAILHSFQQARVTLVDHQTASRQFMIHDLREKRAGRECPAQASWIVPAAGGSTTPVWHHEMRDFQLKPSYNYAADRWLAHLDTMVPGRTITDQQARPKSARPLIVYASETGTAESYAHQTARRLAGLAPAVKSIDEVSLEALASESRVLAIVATCRDGDIPEGGEALVAALSDAEPDALSGTNFAVLGVGNRIYPNFCRAAFTVDAALANAGAERMATLETADEIAGQADTVKHWIELFVKRWNNEEPACPKRRPLVELIPPRRESPWPPKETGTISFNREMLTGTHKERDNGKRSTKFIGVDLPEALIPKEDDGDAAYAAGDHLAVYPANPDDLVARLCEHLGMPQDAWFRAHCGSDDALERFRGGYSIRTLLSRELDLSMPRAPEELLSAMRDTDGEGRAQLESWTTVLDGDEDDPKRQQLLRRLRNDYLTIIDLFDAFPGNVPGFEVLVPLLPRLKPRLYSIASSPRAYPDRIHIMVGVLSVSQSDGRVNRGIGSHYLAGKVPGTPVRIAVKRAPRHLPQSPGGPVIMIGAGTGLAPLFGALEDRVTRDERATAETPVSLYFGCRNEGEFLQRERILGWREDGYLSRVLVALSRTGFSKAYVQDALDADGATVARDLLHPACHVMLCGDARMAHEVETRLQMILQRDGGLGYSAARETLEKMRSDGRFIGDIWGVQLNYDVAMPEIVNERYHRGARWLKQLRRSLTGQPSQNECIRKF